MGALNGVRVLQLGGIGPVPFAAMMLADMGAEVVRVDAPGAPVTHALGANSRGAKSMVLDLKNPAARDVVLKLVESYDVLLEGNRPGVTERLGVGPEQCMARNPRLIYGRMTTYGQTGPYSKRPAHDINAIAFSGVLQPLGPADQPPIPPQALIGDFGGGGMLLAVGVLGALYETQKSGLGQVIDAAMTEGASLLGTYMFELQSRGQLGQRGMHMLDGAAPFYSTYETSDGKYVAVGSIEPQFYQDFMQALGLDPKELPPQRDATHWPATKAKVAAIFKTRTRDEWCALMGARPNCFAPVLAPGEAPSDPHNRARENYIERNGIVQPAPAPRLSRTPSHAGEVATQLGQHSDSVLASAGYSDADIAQLRQAGALG